jgi:mRNA interferase MazF
MTTTAADSSLLQAGDLVWVDLRPTRGREQGGVRPAVVLTDREFHRRNDTAIVCPITSNTAPWPTKVILPDGLAASGAILVDQVRTLDRSSRGFRAVGNVPEDVLAEVRAKLAAVVGIDLMTVGRQPEGM